MINLKSLRLEKNVSQMDVSSAINRNYKSYSRYELEKCQMDYDTLIAVADYFGVSIDYLLGRTKNKRFLASLDETDNFFECSAEEKNLVKQYRQLSNEQKQFLCGVLATVSFPISFSNKKAVAFPATGGNLKKKINKNVKKG